MGGRLLDFFRFAYEIDGMWFLMWLAHPYEALML